MSYTTVLAVSEDMRTEEIEELSNSHGSAPVIWGAMAHRYLGYGRDDFGYMFDGGMERLWPLFKRKDIPLYQRAVLTMTYDRAYVSKENFERAAEDIRMFIFESLECRGSGSGHWDAIARIFESDPDVWAIGFHMTSVSDNCFEGEWDEEKEEYTPIPKDASYEVYDELYKVDEES